MPYLALAVGGMETNAYIFYSALSRRCFIIDPGAEAGKIIGRIESEKLLPLAVVLTHGHADHAGAAAEVIRHFHIPLWLHQADEQVVRSLVNREFAALFGVALPPPAERLLVDGEIIGADDLAMTVIHSPGHTPGSILLRSGNLLFTGDTLFQGDVGRTDLPGGDAKQLEKSLDKIKKFPPASIVLPGHGGASTLEQELATNPYL
ncbi:MAG: MBL fold metallo-hydrolase [Candidatus Aminicenantes bacterium]|nr:MBL fold metallo-hydrolase [Candidatus Aminicenantes bacterium]